jgi:hypothetical protein
MKNKDNIVSLERAAQIIELGKRLRGEQEIPERRFMQRLDDMLLQQENIQDEYAIRYIFDLKSILSSYKERGVPVKYYYNSETKIMNYYVVM